MDHTERPFVVFKFLNQEDSDNEFYDVGLAQWLETEIDANMKTKIKWPSDSKVAGDFVRKEKPAHLSWSLSDILVKRFYDTYINAAEACKQFLCDSNYESSKEMGRGHRIKRKSNRLDSSSEEEQNQANQANVKCGSNSKIPSPPCLKLSMTSGSSKRENLKRNASPRIEIVDSKKAKKANNILQHLRRSNGSSRSSIQNEFLEKLKHKSGSEVRTVVEPKTLKESSKMKQKAIQSTLLTEALQRETLKENREKKLKEATQTFVSHSDATETRPSSTSSNKEGRIDANSPASSTDTAQYMSLKNYCNMEEIPKSNLCSPSATSTNLSSPDSYCDSVSNSSHEGNTEIHDIVEENVSEDSNISQISNRAVERFDVESQVSLSSLKKEVREVSSKLDIVIMNQERLNRFIMPTEKIVKRPSKLPPLPIKTERELTEMEQFLSEENNLSATCAYMSRYVNLEKVKASTFRILRNVVTNSLAKQFSFQGSGTKRAFRSLKLYSVVEGAFVSKEEKFNLTLVESATSLWLVNAAWRKQEDGSSQRSKSHTSQEECSMSSHRSSKSQRLKADSNLSRRSPKKCHRPNEKSRSSSLFLGKKS